MNYLLSSRFKPYLTEILPDADYSNSILYLRIGRQPAYSRLGIATMFDHSRRLSFSVCSARLEAGNSLH